jgi:aspartate racemase
MKKIGIIGGLGAAAGARMYDLLIKECQKNGAVHDSDFPEILLHNLNSTGMNETGIIDHALMRHDLLKSVELLNKFCADVIMIACNSVHVFHEYLQSRSSAEIFNMIEITVDSVSHCSKVGIISSSSTKKDMLYENSLSARGIETGLTTSKQQDTVDYIIAKVISGNHGDRERFMLSDIANSMRKNGAEQIILACTELPLIGVSPARYVDPSVEIIKKVMSL